MHAEGTSDRNLSRKERVGTGARGYIGGCTTSRVWGWAVQNGRAAEVEIFINGKRLTRFRCAEPRPDLVKHGLPTDAGYNFAFGNPLASTDEVSIRFLDGTPLSGSPRKPIRHEGHISLCSVTRVAGWALLDGRPEELDIFVNDTFLARICCDQPVPDLARHGLPANAGYNFIFPAPLLASDEVSVRYLDGTALSGSPRKPIRHEGRLEFCTVSHVTGWATFDGRAAELDVFINDGPVGRLRCSIARPDLPPGIAGDAGFHFRFPQPVTEDGEVSVRFPDGTALTGSPRRPALEYTPHTTHPSKDAAPEMQQGSSAILPQAERIFITPRDGGFHRSANRKVIEAITEARGFNAFQFDQIDLVKHVSVLRSARMVIIDAALSFLALFAVPGTRVCILAQKPEQPLLQGLLNEMGVAVTLFADYQALDTGDRHGQLNEASFASFLEKWLSGET